jgi:hypothetical protein
MFYGSPESFSKHVITLGFLPIHADLYVVSLYQPGKGFCLGWPEQDATLEALYPLLRRPGWPLG